MSRDQGGSNATFGSSSTPLSDTVRGIRSSASSALALVARDNPGVQRLVTGFGQWENQLRNEASRRLAAGAGPGFGPSLKIAGSRPAPFFSPLDHSNPWMHAPSMAASNGASAAVTAGPGARGRPADPEGGFITKRPTQVHLHQRVIGAGAGHAMKRRSASENCLVQLGTDRAARNPATAAGAKGLELLSSAPEAAETDDPEAAAEAASAEASAAQWRRLGDALGFGARPPQQPDGGAVGGWVPGLGGLGAAPANLLGVFGGGAQANLFTAEAALLGSGSQPKPPPPPSAPELEAATASSLPPTPPGSPKGRRGPDPGRPAAATAAKGKGLPRVLTAPSSLHRLGAALGSPPSDSRRPWSQQQPFPDGGPGADAAAAGDAVSETARLLGSALLEQSQEALRTAERSIRETAAICQQNLSTLGNLIQSNVGGLNRPAATTAGVSEPGATWALVPWNVPPGAPRAPPGWLPAPPPGAARRDAVAEPERSPPSRGDRAGQALALAGGGGGTAAGARDDGGEDDGGGAEPAPSPSLDDWDWVTPFDRYMQGAERGREREREKERGRNGPMRSLREPGRQVAIVTTASLPWMTGTSVNPLLRAAYLSTDAGRKVTLVLPWLSPPDQDQLFPADTRFTTPEAQEEYIRDWARKRTGLECNFRISFYPGRYAAEKGSILPVGDITQVIPDSEADVAVLEEPEHLSWYHHGERWTDKFNHVVGVMHTNYLDYARREDFGQVKEMIVKHVNSWVCRAHCHKVIKLSDAVQTLPRQQTMFVHGVSPSFIKVGQRKATEMQLLEQASASTSASTSASASVSAPASGREASAVAVAPVTAAAAAARVQGQGAGAESGAGAGGDVAALPQPWGKGVYFIGKVLWAKGYTELLQRMSEHTQRTGQNVDVDVYGSGPDLKSVQEAAQAKHLNLKFNGARDHADRSIEDYKVFVNPSLSDVVATTTAEALAMGKFVVCADHPSNRFFSSFPNCLIYKDSTEFSNCLTTALSQQPAPLSQEQLRALSWEAATERFLDTAEIQKRSHPLESAVDGLLHSAHNTLTGIEAVRVLIGAGANTRDAPGKLTDYVPSHDEGGPFDNHARARGVQQQPSKGSAS